MRIQLNIERIILEGDTFGSIHAETLRAALETQLRQSFLESDMRYPPAAHHDELPGAAIQRNRNQNTRNPCDRIGNIDHVHNQRERKSSTPMKTAATNQHKKQAIHPRSVGLIQRKCACGKSHGSTAECETCRKHKGKRSVGIQTKLVVGSPHSPMEVQADRVADTIVQMKDVPVGRERSANIASTIRRSAQTSSERSSPAVSADMESRISSLSGQGKPMSAEARSYMEPRFGRDLSQVRIHTSASAASTAKELNAHAFTAGQHIVFARGKYDPGSVDGKRLLAHELVHTLQSSAIPSTNSLHSQLTASHSIQRKTEGEKTFDESQRWLDEDASVKQHVDVLKAALREIRKGKSVEFNRDAGLQRIDALAKILSLPQSARSAVRQQWEWLAKNRKSKQFSSKRREFLATFTSPLAKASKQFPGSYAKYYLRNTPANVFDLIHDVSDAEIGPVDLYAFAANEGLIDVYIRPQIGLGTQGNPTKAQLATVRVTDSISGYDALGLDNFMTDLDARRHPTRPLLPASFDLSKITPAPDENEKSQPVESADFPNLKMALQGVVAVMKRRRRLFLDDAKKLGYSTPTAEELVYFTYLYFNPGEGAGKKTLTDHKGKRKLSDWPKTKFFAGARKVLATYRMIKAMKVFD